MRTEMKIGKLIGRIETEIKKKQHRSNRGMRAKKMKRKEETRK